mmetsp:Transcript_32647/g.44753  ORF Transcript_32647/g.44753 Transcript_32647/m.44753 type:complete len:581 (+) Transcript_32647:285-2027(+)
MRRQQSSLQQLTKAPLVAPYHEQEMYAADHGVQSSRQLSRKRSGEESCHYQLESHSSGKEAPSLSSNHSDSQYKSLSSSSSCRTSSGVLYNNYVDEDRQLQQPQPENKRQRKQQRDSRLRHLARELCPLVDRFGRALTDMAPFLRELAEAPQDPNQVDSPAATGVPSSSSSTSNSSSNTARPRASNHFSLEASLLSFLRERPPSPPPERAYRAPISNQPRMPMAAGASRGGVSVGSNFLTDILSAAGLGGAGGVAPSNNGNSMLYSHSNAQTLSSQQSQQIGGHMDIHIAILSPPSSRVTVPAVASNEVTHSASSITSSNVSSATALTQAVSSLTASLQAQAQSLALRTQQLSDRTAVVTGYSQAISEMLRNANASAIRATTATETSNDAETAGELQQQQREEQVESEQSDEVAAGSMSRTAQSIREARLRIQELNRTLLAFSSNTASLSSAISAASLELEPQTGAAPAAAEEAEAEGEDSDSSGSGLLDDLLPHPPLRDLPASESDRSSSSSGLSEGAMHTDCFDRVAGDTEEEYGDEDGGDQEEDRPSDVLAVPLTHPPSISPPSVFERIRRSLSFNP